MPRLRSRVLSPRMAPRPRTVMTAPGWSTSRARSARTRCEGDSGKRCHDEIRPEPQCWRGTAGFCITLLSLHAPRQPSTATPARRGSAGAARRPACQWRRASAAHPVAYHRRRSIRVAVRWPRAVPGARPARHRRFELAGRSHPGPLPQACPQPTTAAARRSARCARPAPSALHCAGRPAHASCMHPCRRPALVMSPGPLSQAGAQLPCSSGSATACAVALPGVGARLPLRSSHAPPRPPPAHSARCPGGRAQPRPG